MTKPVAVIVGAGIAGLAAAWWLDKAGWRSIILERAADLRENGYMLGLSGLGYETAGRMGLHEALQAASYQIDENVYRDSRGREILRLRYRDFIRGLPYLAIRRTDLIRALHEALPRDAELRFGETLDRVTDHGDHIEAHLASGLRIDADLVIGADGLRSATRHWTGADDSQCLTHLGYYFAVYDVDAPRSFDSDFLSYAEPGHLAEYYALHDGRLAAMHVWRDARPGLEQADDRFGLLQQVSHASHPEVRSLLAEAKAAGARPLIDSLTMVDLPRWSNGRTLLLGDAAHCLTLISGQGAGMALASAEMLGRALIRSTSVDAALLEHDAQLRPIITRLQNRSRKMAPIFIPQSYLAFHLRNILMKNIPRGWLGRYFTNAIRAELDLADEAESR